MNNFINYKSIYISIITLGLFWVTILPIINANSNVLVYGFDDAYIYYKFGDNLADGAFLHYDKSEPPVNGVTSFLYYLITAFSILASRIFFNNKISVFFSAQVIVYVFNLFFYIFSFLLFIKIQEIVFKNSFSDKDELKKMCWMIASLIFVQGNILLASFSGLETCLTTFFIMTIVYSFLINNYYLLFATLLISNLNRPENIVLTVSLVVYFLALKRNKLFLPTLGEKILFFLSAVSTLLIPVINKIYIGSFILSSSSRVSKLGFHSIKNAINNLITFVALPLSAALVNASNLLLFKRLFILLVISLFFYKIVLIVKQSNWQIGYAGLISKTKKLNPLSPKLFILLVISSYLFVPFLVSRGAEWGRYFIPVYPVAILLFIQFLDDTLWSLHKIIKKSIVVFLCFLTLSSLYNIYLIASDEKRLANNFYLPMAQELSRPKYENKKVFIDQAGLLSVYNRGISIDVYGLGTQRYAKIHGEMEKVGDLIRKDRPDYFVTWESKEKKYYLDTAWYFYYLDKENVRISLVKKIEDSTNYQTEEYISFPKTFSLYQVEYN